MELNGEYTFEASQELVWQALQDPQVLGTIMPGGEGFTQVAENDFTGSLNVAVGPVQGKFKAHIRLHDVVPPESYRIEVDGQGAPGFVKAGGRLQLTGQGEQTHLAYEGQAQIGGRIASVGQRLLDASARSIIRQSLEGLNEYLTTQAAAQSMVAAAEAPADDAPVAPPPVPPAYKPPSPTEVALTVAKDVAGDLIPRQYRPVLLALVVVVIAVLYVLLT